MIIQGNTLVVNGVDLVQRANDMEKGFFTNPTTIDASYTIPSGDNAMTAGPVTILDGVTVEIPDGSTWTVV
jgi:hypothetical protein